MDLVARAAPYNRPMLSFEHRMATAMIGTDDEQVRRDVVAFVDGSLAAMPEVLRFGIASIGIGADAWDRARHLGRPGEAEATLAWIEDHPIGLVRQWARAIRSLVLFAENEMLEASAASSLG